MTRSRCSLLIAVCGLALVSPTAAPAQQCECRVFARMYKTKPAMRARIDRQLRQKGVAAPPRRRLKRVIYDYDKTGDFKERFCSRHRRVCRAAAKCLFHAGVSLIFTGLDGEWSRGDIRVAAGACAVAASDSLVFK